VNLQFEAAQHAVTVQKRLPGEIRLPSLALRGTRWVVQLVFTLGCDHAHAAPLRKAFRALCPLIFFVVDSANPFVDVMSIRTETRVRSPGDSSARMWSQGSEKYDRPQKRPNICDVERLPRARHTDVRA
jgi:hypothetical protein